MWGCDTHPMLDHTDFEACYTAVASRDRRFDGRFVTGVLTTGIFCRPSCPARTPLARNVRFFPTPAAAQQVGLRACRRCRPELAPDAAGADPARELATRALRLIDDGAADEGVEALAGRLYVSPRHLQRILVDTYGAGPAALGRMRRTRIARLLVDQTDLPLGRVAFAAGFGSVRQFNDAFRDAFGTSPSAVRRGRTGPVAAGMTVTLPVRTPFDATGVLSWAALHAVPSRDEVTPHHWIRHGDTGTTALAPTFYGVRVTVDADAVTDLRPAVALARQVFDVDADVEAITAALGGDPVLGPLVAERPGVRIPGAPHPFEGAVRVVVGQQVSAKGATTLMSRLAALTDRPGLPHADQLADADLEAAVGLTRQRAGAVRALARAVVDGLDLSPGAAPDETVDALRALPGIGPWTAATIALVVLRQPDAWPTGDLALRRALEGLTGRSTSSADLDARARDWRPWRGYAALHLWHHHLQTPTQPPTRTETPPSTPTRTETPTPPTTDRPARPPLTLGA